MVDNCLPRTAWHALFVTFVVCTLVSWLLVGVGGPRLGFSQSYGLPNHDGYLEIASTLRAHGRYAFEADGPPVLHRPPLYPLLLTTVHAVLGPNRYALCAVQGLIAGILVSVAFVHTRRILGLSTARWLVVAVLAYPWLYWHVKNPMTPLLLGTLYWAFLSSWTLARSTQRVGWWSLTGVVGGLMALTHGSMLLLPLAVGFGAALRQLTRRQFRAMIGPSISIVLFVVTISPWTIRNYAVAGRIIPVSTNAGFTYFWGLVIMETTFGKEIPDPGQGAFDLAGIAGDASVLTKAFGVLDPELDAEFNERMVEHALRHPGQLVLKSAINACWFWLPLRLHPESLVLCAIHGTILVLGFVGLRHACRDGRPVAPTIACVLYTWSVHAVILSVVGHAQYAFGPALLLMPFVVFAISRLFGARPHAAPSPAAAASDRPRCR